MLQKGDVDQIQCIVNKAGKNLGVSWQDFETAYADLLIKRLGCLMWWMMQSSSPWSSLRSADFKIHPYTFALCRD